MKKVTFIACLLLFVSLLGCGHVDSNDEHVTEEEAKQIVIDERTRECCGEAEIIDVTSDADKYIIRWEIESIDEFGKDSIHKQTGKIKAIESSRGTCKIR